MLLVSPNLLMLFVLANKAPVTICLKKFWLDFKRITLSLYLLQVLKNHPTCIYSE